MKYVSPALALLAALTFQATVADAAPITFETTLTGALEVPPTGSPGTGTATVILDPTANSMHVDVTFASLTSGTTASHIHCCLASPFETGANVMVATTTPTFPNFPLGVTSGTYSQDFSLLDPATYNPAFITSSFNPSGTVAGAELVLIAAIEAGETYLNIHTKNFPSGEIRGFLTPVPEPASLLALVSAIVGFGLMRWRRA